MTMPIKPIPKPPKAELILAGAGGPVPGRLDRHPPADRRRGRRGRGRGGRDPQMGPIRRPMAVQGWEGGAADVPGAGLVNQHGSGGRIGGGLLGPSSIGGPGIGPGAGIGVRGEGPQPAQPPGAAAVP